MLRYFLGLQPKYRILLSLLLLIHVSTSPIYLDDRSPNAVGRGHQSVWILCASGSGGLRVRIFDIVRIMGREWLVFVVGWFIGVVAGRGDFSEGRSRECRAQKDLELTRHQRHPRPHRNLTLLKMDWKGDEV